MIHCLSSAFLSFSTTTSVTSSSAKPTTTDPTKTKRRHGNRPENSPRGLPVQSGFHSLQGVCGPAGAPDGRQPHVSTDPNQTNTFHRLYQHHTSCFPRRALLGSGPYCSVWQIIWRSRAQNSVHKAFSLVIQLEVNMDSCLEFISRDVRPPPLPSFHFAHPIKIRHPPSNPIQDFIDNHVNKLTKHKSPMVRKKIHPRCWMRCSRRKAHWLKVALTVRKQTWGRSSFFGVFLYPSFSR